ncbi:MAG: hypothetical protein AAFS08_12140 [Pseudomonadota bacterium]
MQRLRSGLLASLIACAATSSYALTDAQAESAITAALKDMNCAFIVKEDMNKFEQKMAASLDIPFDVLTNIDSEEYDVMDEAMQRMMLNVEVVFDPNTTELSLVKC